VIRHKFHAVAVKRDGHRFDSKAEARFYDNLCFQQKAGHIVCFLRQVPIHYPGGGKLVIDFLVFYKDGSCEFIDVKGMSTQTYKAKKRIVESIYPFKIREVK